jgi:hypothetical protein
MSRGIGDQVKIVMRHLPPDMTEAALLGLCTQFKGVIRESYFVAGKKGCVRKGGSPAPCVALCGASVAVYAHFHAMRG